MFIKLKLSHSDSKYNLEVQSDGFRKILSSGIIEIGLKEQDISGELIKKLENLRLDHPTQNIELEIYKDNKKDGELIFKTLYKGMFFNYYFDTLLPDNNYSVICQIKKLN